MPKYIQVKSTARKPSEGERCTILLPKVFSVVKDVEVLDVEKRVDPYRSGADAFAYTDKGVHLFYVAPNRPTDQMRGIADQVHRQMNQDGANIFFVSKHDHERPRSCVALMPAGLDFANEYNRLVSEELELPDPMFTPPAITF